MSGATKLMTAGGGGVNITPSASIASDVTVQIPSVDCTLLSNKTAGTVLQVVSATYSVQTLNNSTTLASSGLSASITPTSASSKILVLISDPFRRGSGSVGGVNLHIYRNGASIYSPGASMFYSSPSNTSDVSVVLNMNYLDSPATTSAVTYAFYFALASGNSGYGAYAQIDGYPGTITLMEIAA